jgi:cell wall-associated NlpC family hydrolase
MAAALRTAKADRAAKALRAATARRTATTRAGVTGAVGRRPATPVRRTVVRRPLAPMPRMARVVAWAWAQVGKPYRRGAAGPHAFDCSGFTMRAYRLAGYRLPHSSGGQAARARPVRRALARPGDLVVGPGHVGVYMGRGMMVDAGTPRTGVVYRRLYAGLRIARL